MKKNIGIIFSLVAVIIFTGSFINVNKAIALVDDPALLNAKVTPVITSISPLSAKIGDVITIKGENFQRLDYVTFNTVRTIAESFDKITGKEIKVKVPAGATDGKITVMNFSNLSTVSSDIFRIITAEYIVSDISSITMTSALLKVSGLMTSQAYQLSVYDRTAQAPFKAWTLNTASDGTIEFPITGLTAGHSYDVSLDLNLDGNITHRQIGFDTLIDKNAPINTPTPTPTPIQDNGSKIVPTCNTGGIENIDKVTGQYKNPCDFNYFMLLLNNLIKFVLFTIATPLVALIIMYTAYLFLTAGGSPGQTEKAKHILFNVVIGYIVALAAWLVVNTIMTTLLDKNAGINTFLDKGTLQK